MSDIIAGRDVYLLASRILAREIDKDLYRFLIAADGPLENFLIDEEIKLMSEEAALEELAVEYCRLFLSPNALCPPYASVQRGEALLGGRSEQQLIAFIERHGLNVLVPSGIPILSRDHLAVELALLYELCAPAAGRSVPQGLPLGIQDAARELVEMHLMPWAPEYLRNLRSTSRLAPYRTIADLTERLLVSMPGRLCHLPERASDHDPNVSVKESTIGGGRQCRA